ncbi:MAG: hypothetical protein V7L14_05320 [Nostoc sp.]|uniref:hypothetical protein n=1 Tax=Nostoc sp. TaxID=1180 RepID=UPI002FFB79B6
MKIPIYPTETNILATNFLHKIQMLTLKTRELYGKPMLYRQFCHAIAPMLQSKTLSCT